MKIIVLGSGIIGASIAYHLAIRGGDVTLVDRAPPASAPGATWASAGGLRSQGRHAAEHPITLAAARRWPSLPGRRINSSWRRLPVRATSPRKSMRSRP